MSIGIHLWFQFSFLGECIGLWFPTPTVFRPPAWGWREERMPTLGNRDHRWIEPQRGSGCCPHRSELRWSPEDRESGSQGSRHRQPWAGGRNTVGVKDAPVSASKKALGQSRRSAGSALDLHQHLRIVREFLQEEQQALHRLGRAVAGEAAADEVDLVEHVIG